MYKAVEYSLTYVNPRLIHDSGHEDYMYSNLVFAKFAFDTRIRSKDIEEVGAMNHWNATIFAEERNEINRLNSIQDSWRIGNTIVSLRRLCIDDLFFDTKSLYKYILPRVSSADYFEWRDRVGWDIEDWDRHINLIKDMICDCTDEFFD